MEALAHRRLPALDVQLVADINTLSGPSGADPQDVVPVGRCPDFTADRTTTGRELRKSDGTVLVPVGPTD